MFAKHTLVIFITVLAFVSNKCTSLALAAPNNGNAQTSATDQNSVLMASLSSSTSSFAYLSDKDIK
jgi:hypothetical protein